MIRFQNAYALASEPYLHLGVDNEFFTFVWTVRPKTRPLHTRNSEPDCSACSASGLLQRAGAAAFVCCAFVCRRQNETQLLTREFSPLAPQVGGWTLPARLADLNRLIESTSAEIPNAIQTTQVASILVIMFFNQMFFWTVSDPWIKRISQQGARTSSTKQT